MNETGKGSGEWCGKWALITGSSSGIGLAIAEQLAASGAHLVLTARRADRLNSLAETLTSRHDIRVIVVQADLNDPHAPAEIFAATQAQRIEVDILVNNAGLGDYGEFCTSDLSRQLSMVQVHCHAVIHLTHLYLAEMVKRQRGHVLIVATTALVPAPYLTTYAATKGFDLLFAEGLAEEVARHGVRVAALCPGPTQSELMGTPDILPVEENHGAQSAQSVAREALLGLARGPTCIRPSLLARLMANVPRFLPRATISGMTERYYRPPHL